ncbi:hypothetical protein [Dubosiella newyorkensis]|uniref:hypothetical protein n=1 Tax=Dubosiella newyorkensis TaxID=1862672 RepID=UPI0023F2CC47|nr:hypothetical protein [Dubosiella newyorkensis]
MEGCNSIEVNQDGIFLFRISDHLMKNWNPSEPFAWYSNESKMEDYEIWETGGKEYDSSILEKLSSTIQKVLKSRSLNSRKIRMD